MTNGRTRRSARSFFAEAFSYFVAEIARLAIIRHRFKIIVAVNASYLEQRVIYFGPGNVAGQMHFVERDFTHSSAEEIIEPTTNLTNFYNGYIDTAVIDIGNYLHRRRCAGLNIVDLCVHVINTNNSNELE